MNVTSNRTIYVGLASETNKIPTARGLLKLVRRGVLESGEFAYGHRYQASANAFALNPDFMPLADAPMKVAERRLRDGGALPLTFRDALPDSWGRLVLETQYGKKLDDIDALLLTNTDRIGAMVFSETLPIPLMDDDTQLILLEELAVAVKRIELSLELTPEMRRLLQRGGTLGGARPKATFIHDRQRWIAKFPAQGDDHDVELLEFCIHKLAQMCGIEVSPAKLEKIHRGHALLLLRFDRAGTIGNEQRIHYLSASALLNAPYESNAGSYMEFAQLIRRVSVNPKQDLEQLFKRMVFNLMIDNTDDHVKNHGMLYVNNGKYKLAPAFDLVMQLTNMGYQELAILTGNHDSKIHLVKEVAPYFGMNEKVANEIIETIHRIVNNELINLVKQNGCDDKLVTRVRKCLERQQQLIYD